MLALEPNLCGDFKKVSPTKWTPTSYKWSYNPYKLPAKWVTGFPGPTL